MDFLHYWQYTDWLTKTLFFILIGLSIATWTVGLQRYIVSRKMGNQAVDQLRKRSNSLQPQLAALDTTTKKQLAEQAMLQELNQFKLDTEKHLSVLGTTAAIAPFIGLFGTVWGIFHALHAIGASGEAGLGQVAGPVGEALIMTALGLAVAIPAVILYNLCARANRKAYHVAQDTAHDIVMEQLSNVTRQHTQRQ